MLSMFALVVRPAIDVVITTLSTREAKESVMVLKDALLLVPLNECTKTLLRYSETENAGPPPPPVPRSKLAKSNNPPVVMVIEAVLE